MKTNAMKFFCLSALALLLVVGVTDEAQARIRAKKSRVAPRVLVQVDTGAFRISGGYGKALPGRLQEGYRVTRKDRKIAGRLGRYTGVSKRELIQLKKLGYSWNEIGRWMGISPKVVRAAKSNHKWERFINRRHRGRYCEIGGR